GRGRLSGPTCMTVYFSPSSTVVSAFNISRHQSRLRAHSLPLTIGLALLGLAEAPPALAQKQQAPQQLEPVEVSPGTPHGTNVRPTAPTQAAPKRTARRTATRTSTAPASRPSAPVVSTPAATPLNGNVVPAIATRLGLTAHETPASVDIVTQQQMQEQ